MTERGKTLIPLIRRLLETNDQILQIGGAAQDPRPVRVGLSFLYGKPFVCANDAERLRGLNIICDHSLDLMRGMAEGYIDVCATFQPTSTAGTIITSWQENLVWVRSANFTLSPGSPVPLVGWPGLLADQIAMKLLEAKGIAYRLSFTSIEHYSRIEAVRAGLGVMIVPDWIVPDDLVEAREYYLPVVPPVEAEIMRGDNVDIGQAKNSVDMLKALVKEPLRAVSVA